MAVPSGRIGSAALQIHGLGPHMELAPAPSILSTVCEVVGVACRTHVWIDSLAFAAGRDANVPTSIAVIHALTRKERSRPLRPRPAQPIPWNRNKRLSGRQVNRSGPVDGGHEAGRQGCFSIRAHNDHVELPLLSCGDHHAGNQGRGAHDDHGVR